jgi:hypothetical protein
MVNGSLPAATRGNGNLRQHPHESARGEIAACRGTEAIRVADAFAQILGNF